MQPFGSDQTISQPYTVAFQTELLQTKPKDVVLEIGTGSGYQACVLHDLVKRVYSIERQETLYSRTSRLLEKLGYGMIRNMLGDGFAGLPRFAPFDKILVTCGANKIPQELLSQLKEGGMMVIPVGAKNQRMIRITRNGDQFTEEDFGPFQFVPMLEGINKFDLSKVKSRSNAR